MLHHVTTSGTPYELGRQHGEQTSHLAQKAVDFYTRHSPAEAAGFLREAKRIEGILRQRCPELLEEIEGIAAGSGLPYDDILLLNMIYEVQVASQQQCTVIGLPRSPDGPLIGKTDDVTVPERELEVFYRLEPEEGYACIYYAIAGTVWAVAGVNEKGLVQAMTGLVPGRIENPDGIPACILLRLILQQCATVEEAIALTKAELLLRYGHTLTLADPWSGEIVVVEDYPTAFGVRRSSDQTLVQTNHCLVPETIPQMRTKEEQDMIFPGLWENSRNRYQNATRLAQEIPRSVEGLKQFLSDHTTPGAICQHGQADLHTSVATILIPRQRAMIASEGYGCGSYQEWRI